MEAYEDDDDTHFCIKCHLTINGLDNYVRHRQSGCRPPETKQETVHDHRTTPTTVSYPEILNADAFFSSLELQSSSKSNSAPRGRNERERKPGKTDEKKNKKVRKAQDHDDGGAKEKLLNMPPVVTDLDDLMDHLGIPSLVGFPEIVTSTGSKSSAVVPSKSACVASSSKANNDDNLQDSPLETMMTSSKGSTDRKRNADSQRIEQDHGEWLEDPILDDLDGNSENKEVGHEEIASYAEYDYQNDEESDVESLDDDVADEDTDSDDDEADDHEYPQESHTGGKWKPSELLHDISRLNDDELDQDDDNQEHPSVPHTGGKWKPADSSQLQRVEADDEVAGKDPGASSLTPSPATRQEPMPGHTRGKWIPGAVGDLGSGYWCDPCGRKLASRLLYNRHLLSDLHARRSIQEIDGDLQLPRGPRSLLLRKSASKRQRALAEIKLRSKNSKPEVDKEAPKKRTRRREKEVLWCEMCHARVRRPQMGKHLLSHYHCRVAGTNPRNSPAARRFILENMGNVVRQCPFQCASCRFYCNTEETFLLHWRSKLHATSSDDTGGNYKCTPCNFWCKENDRMEDHLKSSGHREAVAMMNGSVPVVIRRQRSLICETCNRHFRYNVQLRFHMRETGHRGNSTATDDYQSKIVCVICSRVLKSLVALQRHQLSCHEREEDVEDEETQTIVHPSAPYFCSFCTLNFATPREAVLHRRTPRHKETVKAQKMTSDNIGSLGRECRHCGAKQSSLVEHRKHLLERHPELCHRCPRCGMIFALPQDVTKHTRKTECGKTVGRDVERLASNDEDWRCGKCSFVTDSQAEFIFHDALHAGRIEEGVSAEEGGSSKTPVKYRCPMCEKSFTKSTLRNHLRNHTGERPFRCLKCSATFSRRNGLNAHRKECLISSTSSISWTKDAEYSRQRNHTCSECNTAFYTNRPASRYVSYQEVYTKRKWGLFKKRYTRINYKWEYYTEWFSVNQCCIGYVPQGIETSICQPVCRSGCLNGKCAEPNVCSCNFGYLSMVSIEGLSHCVPHCIGPGPDGCGLHGLCASPGFCACHDGYSLDILRQKGSDPCSPDCNPECINGVCTSPDNCVCNYGYKKTSEDPKNKCSPICNPACVNGTCAKPGYCECHNGHKKDPKGSPEVCLPVCDPSCVNATCTGPNHCQCHNGFQKKSAESPESCSPICDPACVNGTCTKPGYCECHDGHKKDPKGSPEVCLPVCDPSCVNATCTGPNHCQCHNGFQKKSAESPESCSPICDPACVNGTCTKPGYCECHDGHKKDPKGSPELCLPVCDPSCVNATCTGPNHCQCHNGFQKKSAESPESCSPICDPACVNGTCTKPGYCECHNGYEKTQEGQSELCSPVCNPGCNRNAFCDSPNRCLCNTGYTVAIVNSSLVTTGKPGETTDESIFNLNAISCEPVCEAGCGENESCVAPNICQCNPGYRAEMTDATNLTKCLPICEPNCVNAYCGYPNKCICLSDYTPSLVEDFVCQPICVNGCFNATCTLPNHCECHDGYVKGSITSESLEDQEIYENTCVPNCPGQCLNGTCIAPGECLCDPGYVLNGNFSLGSSNETTDDYADDSNNTIAINETFVQSCQPFCEPGCPIGRKCLSPNQCELQPDDAEDVNESSTNSMYAINSIEDCGRNVDFLDEYNKCVCKHGWTGWRCEKSSLCGLIVKPNSEDYEESTTLQSMDLSNDTIEPIYDDFMEMRMISDDDDSGVIIDWQGPMCMEECRFLMTSTEISRNRSDEIVNCYLLKSENVTTGVLFVKDRALQPGNNNASHICFISVESQCNAAILDPSCGSTNSFLGIIIGVVILLSAIVTVAGLAIYFRKTRPVAVRSAVSMCNSAMLINSDTTSFCTTEESSSL